MALTPARAPTRGLIDNNPGNIRAAAGTDWLGQVGIDAHGFAVFDTPAHGLRALARTLLVYRQRHGLDTIAAIVARWAPPADGNDTAGYIAAVAQRMGVASDAPLDLADPATLQDLMAAIVHQEQGTQPFAADDLAAAAAAAAAADGKIAPVVRGAPPLSA